MFFVQRKYVQKYPCHKACLCFYELSIQLASEFFLMRRNYVQLSKQHKKVNEKTMLLVGKKSLLSQIEIDILLSSCIDGLA